MGSSQERNSCVPASVKSSPVAKDILPSSSDHDILAKYNPEKFVTLSLVTVFILLMTPAAVIVTHMTPLYKFARSNAGGTKVISP